MRRAERVAFALAVGLAAAAGSLVSLIGTTTPAVGRDLVLDGFVVVVIGGMGSIAGSLVAAALIGAGAERAAATCSTIPGRGSSSTCCSI